jgi:methionyl-tRNA synthetase
MNQKLFVTTPIYYVNDRPHIGHSYTTIAADVIARFSRMKNQMTFFLTGTDEHGSKVAESAKASGKNPQEFCDFNAKFYKEAWKNLSISYDYFVRTTDKRHEQAVFKFLEKLYKAKTKDGKSVIYSGEYEGLYCVGCEKFVTEKDLVEGLCPDHQKKPEKVKEKNYFFRLSSFLEEVEKLIQRDKIRILPEERRRETLGLFKQGLEDFSISREKVTWGIPLPFDPSQKVYVWVDALQNYISAIGYGDDQDELDLWWNKSQVVHLIGKDILKFHCIFWPAMLLAAGEKPPDTIFVHGFFTVDGKKMGKSLGNVIDPHYLIEKFGSDAVRYLLLTQFPFGQDGDIQENRFSEKYNSDLANDLGNLVSRVLKMVLDFSGGEIPQPDSYQQKDKEIINSAEDVSKKVYEHIENININSAADEILKLVRSTNKYIEDNAPWNLAKNKEKARLDTVLYTSCESLRFISLLFYPFLPEKCRRIRELLGFKGEQLEPSFESEKSWGFLKPKTKVGKPESLFPRWVKEKIEEKGKEKKEKEVVTFEEFSRLDLRVAKVIEAERVAGTNKLLKLKIDIGGEERTIVAGIAENYSCEELLGKKIVVIVNLAPAKIKGIESKGMLLAAEDENGLALVILDKDIKAGTKIS